MWHRKILATRDAEKYEILVESDARCMGIVYSGCPNSEGMCGINLSILRTTLTLLAPDNVYPHPPGHPLPAL